jgi:hypothetical protein
MTSKPKSDYYRQPNVPPMHEIISEVLTPEVLEPDANPEAGKRAVMRVIRRYMTTTTGIAIVLDAVASHIADHGAIRLDVDYRERNAMTAEQVRLARYGLRELAAATGWFDLYEPGNNPTIVYVTPTGVQALRSVAVAA